MTAILVLDVGTTSVRAAIVDERPARSSPMARRPFAAVDAVPRPRRVRRRRARPPRARRRRRGHGRRRRADRRPSASPTSGRARSSGTAPPASRSGPALGWQDLRTVGECIAAAGRARPRAGPEPVGDQARLAARPTSPGAARPRPLLRHRRHVAGVVAVRRRRCTSPTTPNAAVTGLLGRRRRRAGTSGVLDALGIPAGAAADARRLDAASSARPPRCPARRRSPRSSATSRRRSSARAASRRGGPRSRSAPAGCSTCAAAPTRRPSAAPRRARHVPDRGVVARRRAHVGRRGDHAVGRHERRVAARRPRPDRHQRREPRRRGVGRRQPTASCTCRRCSASARRTGTTAPAARCSALTRGTTGAHVVRAVLEGVAHRGADLVEAAEADTGLTIERAAGRRRDERQPDVHPGARRRHRPAGRGVAGRRGDDARAPPSSPAWRPACGATSPTPTARGAGPRATSRARRSTGRRGRGPSSGPAGWIPELSALDV